MMNELRATRERQRRELGHEKLSLPQDKPRTHFTGIEIVSGGWNSRIAVRAHDE